MSVPLPDSSSDSPKTLQDHTFDLEKNLAIKHNHDLPVPDFPQTLPQHDSHDRPIPPIIAIPFILALHLTALCVWFFANPCLNPTAHFLAPLLLAMSCSMAFAGWLRSSRPRKISAAGWNELSQLFLVLSYIFTGFFLTQSLHRACAIFPDTASASDPVCGH